jgi:hypothetical protein
MNIKKLIYLLGMLIMITSAMPLSAQTEQLSKKQLKKLEKQKKKAAKEQAEKLEYEKVKQLVKDTTFVFIANRLYGPGGKTFNLNQTLNFLAVNKHDATYQFSFHGIIGWNGVGGVTFNGDVNKYEYKFGKNINKASYIEMIFRPRGVGGLPYINITFFGSSATMDLTLDDGTRIRLDGQIKSIQEADIIKGHSIF